jgi:hypothetical protein
VAVYDERGPLLALLRVPTIREENNDGIQLIRIGPGDSLHVVVSGGYVVYTPELHRIRQVHLRSGGRVNDAIPLDSGRVVVQSVSMTPDLIGHPFHVAAADGRIERSFGYDGEVISFADPLSLYWSFSAAEQGRFWAARRNRYIVTKMDVLGGSHTILYREAAWFPAWDGDGNGQPWISHPEPHLWSHWSDREDRLWLMSTIADHRWQPIGGMPDDRESLDRLIGQVDSYLDTVIEVIDVAGNRLVATQREDEVFQKVGDGFIFRLVMEPSSNRFAVEIHHIDIEPSSERVTPRGGSDILHRWK